MFRAGAAAIAAALFVCAGAGRAAVLPPEWTTPVPPFRIADDLYYVGTQDLAAYLVTTRDGLMLLDVGVPGNAPKVLASIKALGFDPRQVRILINSHAHFDHAGGLAAIKAATGAKLYASRGDAPVLESGGAKDFIPITHFPAVKVDHLIRDGEAVSLGGTTLTAHLTPGHTKGCTSWSMPLRVDGVERQVLFLCSVSVLSQYRLVGNTAYPGIADDYAESFDKLQALPCEVFLGAHGSFYGLAQKRLALARGVRPNPFLDPQGCRAFIANGSRAFRDKLEAQRDAVWGPPRGRRNQLQGRAPTTAASVPRRHHWPQRG